MIRLRRATPSPPPVTTPSVPASSVPTSSCAAGSRVPPAPSPHRARPRCLHFGPHFGPAARLWLPAALCAIAFLPALPAASQRQPANSAAAPSPAAQASSPAWQPVGPLQVNTPSFGLATGSVTSIAADPSDASGNTVYIGTNGGGLWKSTNAAAAPASVQFAPLTDALSVWSPAAPTSLSIGAVSVQPGGTGVLLAGTGDPNNLTTSWYGVGILRSADNGNSWTLIRDTATALSGVHFNFTGSAFAGFAWSTATPGVVVAAVTDSGYGDIAGIGNTQSALGLFYSLDAGITWQMATLQDGSTVIQSSSIFMTGTNAATAVVWNPLRQRFYAAIRYHGYYESADGLTWTRLTTQPAPSLTSFQCPSDPGSSGSPACPIYRGALAVQPVTGDMFALTVDENSLDQGLGHDTCNLQAGACTSPVQFATQIPDQPLDSPAGTTLPEALYSLQLAAVPAQQDTLLFIGLTDLWRCSLAAGCVWKNTTNTQTCATARVAPLQQALDATFGASGLLYFGTGSGLWRSTDAVNQLPALCSADDASHFQNLNGALGSLAQVESFAQDPTHATTWLAALGALGTAAPPATGIPWNQVLGGEGDVVAIDPANPQNWYATSVFGIGIQTCPQGTACTPSGFGTVAIGEAQVDNDVETIAAPWILDPANSSNLLLGTCRVWRGPANGSAWTDANLLSSMLDGDPGPFCNGNAEIRSLAAGLITTPNSPAGAEQLYAGIAGVFDGGGLAPGHLFTASVNSESQASSTQWTDRYASPVVNAGAGGSQFNPAGADVSSVYVDPHDPTGQTLYVTIRGLSGAQQSAWLLYVSTDAGAHWYNITSNLPQSPANSVLVDPNNANIVYVALDSGVWVTQNVTTCTPPGAACWNAYGSGLPTAPVTSLLAWNQSPAQTLRAATFGRGIWQIPLLTAGIQLTTATLTPASLTFPAQNLQTASAPQTLTLTNTGQASLQVASLSISGDFTESDTCAGASIAPGATCQIAVTFDPSQTGARSGTLTVFANLTGGQLAASLAGTGLGAALIQLTPPSLTYGAEAIGSPAPAQSITIANIGSAPAALTSETVTGDFHLTANTCAASLPTATSCTVSIDFVPTAAGSRTGSLTIVSALGVQTAPLSGTGQSPATDGLAPASLTFAAQQTGTTSAPQSVTLTNTGDEPLTQIVVAATADFTWVNNCGPILQGHGSCTISVAYTPTRTGAETGSLTVADAIRSQTVALSGTGLAPPGVSATPLSVNFGGYAVGTTSAPQTVTVTNSGGVPLASLSATVTAGFAIAANNCPATLAAGAACPLSLTFSPTAAGAASGTLTLSSPSLARPLTVALSGFGDDFSLSVTGSSSAVLTSGQSATYTLQLSGLAGTSGAVTLSCAGAPQNATCSLNPASLTLNGVNPASTTVTVATGVAASAALHPAGPWTSLGPLFAPLFALVLPIAAFGRRRRRLASWLVLLAVCFLLPLGCGVSASSGSGGSGGSGSGGSGSGGSGGGSSTPTPSGTYTLTVTATMSSVTHTAPLTLTVQ